MTDACAQNLASVRDLVSKFCYVFPKIGMDDLKLRFSPVSMSFMQERSHVPFPRNGFYQLDPDRYPINLEVYKKTMDNHTQDVPAPMSLVYAFVSVANAVRSTFETTPGTPERFDRVVRIYENAIRLSGDESGIKIINLISKREQAVTFCSTDDETSNMLPTDVRQIVGEAFAGLAMCALHQGRIHQSIGYATAALFKHRCALPMVSCARIMAVWLGNRQAIMFFTEMVLLPFYIRINDNDMLKEELSLWAPSIQQSFGDLPHKLAATAASFQERYAGRFVVVKAKYKNAVFIEKLCRVCGKGDNGEKLFSCVRCGNVYYCGKQCQKAHWPHHKPDCTAQP